VHLKDINNVVIPAQAGIQNLLANRTEQLDSRLRGNDSS
jgi:hypothetical protein